VDFDDSIALLGVLLVPGLASGYNHCWSDAHQRLQSFELDVAHLRDVKESPLDLIALLATLELLDRIDKLLVSSIRNKVRIAGQLGRNRAAEGILVDVVHTLDTDNAVIHEHAEKKEQETAELEVRPVAPELTEAVAGWLDNVVDEEVGDPDASATETLKDGTKNCRGVLSHEHTKQVVAKDNGGIEDTSSEDGTVVEEHVKGFESLLTTVLLRDVRSEAEKDGARDGTPETLKTDNEHGVENDLLQKILLNDDLGSLDDLGENDQSAAKGSLGGSVRAIAGLLLRAADGERGAVQGGKSDDDEREGDDADTSPVGGVELTLEEEL